MGGVDRVITKVNSIVEGKISIVKSGGKMPDKKSVEEAIENGTFISNNPELRAFPCNAHEIKLPHVDEFLRKYPHFLREPEKYFGA